MADDGMFAPEGQAFVDPFDPVALEVRLKEARQRRAGALASRQAPQDSATSTPPPQTPAKSARRTLPSLSGLMFVAGLSLGVAATATAILAPQAVRSGFARIASIASLQPRAPQALSAGIAIRLPPPGKKSMRAILSANAPVTFIRTHTRVAGPPDPGGPLPSRAQPVRPELTARLSDPTQPPPASRLPNLPARDLAPLIELPGAATSDALRLARVLVHYPSNAGAAAKDAVAALQALGVANVVAVPAGLTISRTNIRYYHDSDQAAAILITAALSAGAVEKPPEARDFTSYSPQPAQGKLEVWLAGRSNQAATRRKSKPTPQSIVKSASQATAAAVKRLFGRIGNANTAGQSRRTGRSGSSNPATEALDRAGDGIRAVMGAPDLPPKTTTGSSPVQTGTNNGRGHGRNKDKAHGRGRKSDKGGGRGHSDKGGKGSRGKSGKH